MILIQTSSLDVSSNNVIRWLIYYRAKYLRINDRTLIKNISFIDNSFLLELPNNQYIDTKMITAYWYRRGEYEIDNQQKPIKSEEFNKKYYEYIFHEYKSIGDFFTSFLSSSVHSVGDSSTCQFVNKNIILNEAKQLGLNTPEFIITSSKKQLIIFCANKKTITKPIHSSFLFEKSGYSFPTYTELITEKIINEAPEEFKPTLFQEYIEKRFEIRTFYLNGKFFSMAIFSQNNTKTAVDFRVYDKEKPNRSVPFKLPEQIELKIEKLMNKMNYNSGSIDLIYTPNNDFYFLEVNPIGQYGMVSVPCNYPLDKEFADFLTKK